VDSDRLIRKNKGGGRPIINEYDRLRMVDSIKYVDYAFIMDKHEELDQTYKLFNCDFLFRNGDFTNNNITLNEVVIPDVKSLTSTTDIINNIRGVKCK
jgi:bifunctional ADP-heptose synthase (sugar kinase/adenylyltransferase)